MKTADRIVIALVFLRGNFVYQWLQNTPDYAVAMDRTFWEAMGMVFIIFYPKLIEKGLLGVYDRGSEAK